MNKYEAILAGVIITLIIGFFTSCSFQNNDCRKEAIKANVDPILIRTICR